MPAPIKLSHITISYPPDYDGELHIACVANSDSKGKVNSITYMFTHAVSPTENMDQIAWETLVQAAEAIVCQKKRRAKTQP